MLQYSVLWLLFNRGVRKTLLKNPITSKCYMYLGIRYAQSPTGSLRFKKPVPPTPEPDVIFNANIKPDACYQHVDTLFQVRILFQIFWSPTQTSPGARMWQPNTPLAEDCLFLNIWVPILPASQKCEKDTKLPVMVRRFNHFYFGRYGYLVDLSTLVLLFWMSTTADSCQPVRMSSSSPWTIALARLDSCILIILG